MNFAKFSVTRPVAVIMRIAALVLLGAICLTKLPVDLLPKVSLPTVAVITNWPNVGPEEMETQITRPVEQAVGSVNGLYQISSSSTEGSSSVRVQFNWGVDMGQAAVDVMQLVQRAQRRFPQDDTLQTPMVFKFDPNQQPILIFGVSGEPDPVKLRTLLDNQVTPMIESANGVASATVNGGLQRSIMVDVDSDRLRAYHLSLQQIGQRLSQENANLPAGVAKQGNTEFRFRSLGWFQNVQEIRDVPVGSYSGRLVRLGDVATVRDAAPEQRVWTRMNGEPSVGIVVSKQSGVNTVSTAEAVMEKVRQAQKMYPNLRFGIAYDQAKFISASIDDVKTNAMIGAVLAVLVLLFFLRNVRSTLVVALSIPTSIISTFALLYLCGFTLNTMSLGGLALATGLIVDDAVVVLENIFRHIERDKKRAPEAAVSGATEIVSAVLASTMTVMVVFLPLLLIQGQAGQMFTQFALVVIFSLAVSLLDATTVVPMLASRLIKGEAHHENLADDRHRTFIERLFYRFGRSFDALDAGYRRALAFAIHHRYIVIGGAVLVTVASLALVPMIGTELMPPTDSGDFDVNIKMPIGTAVDVTNRTMRQIEDIIRANPNVAVAFGTAGAGGRGGGASNRGQVSVRLKEDRKQPTLQVMGDLRRQLARVPGATARPDQHDVVSMLMTGGNQNIEIDIFGGDLTTLSNISDDVISRVRGIPGLENVDVNWDDSTPEIQWRVDRQKAIQMGISFSDVADTVNTATTGEIASYYQEGGYQYPIIVNLPEAQRKTVDELKNLVVRPGGGSGVGATGQPRPDVLLGQVARPSFANGPSQITRQDRQRYIAVTGQPQGRSPGEIQADVEKALADMHMPAGYYWDWGTNQKRQAEEFGGMGLAVFLAIALIYMLLATQFESLVHPLTILASVPLSAVGVILALFLTGRSFGLTAFIGLLMLVGIVVKNGILLVDYTNQLRGRGLPREEAVLTASPTRLRPILMTSSATVLGMLPIALGLGKGSETQAPMATAVIGGLTTSTMLTLFVVPTVYTIFDDIARWLRRNREDLAPSSIVEPSVAAVVRERDEPGRTPEPID